MKTWKGGPPPSLGWWPASTARYDDMYRWWNGQFWSIGVHRDVGNWADLNKMASIRGQDVELVEWTERPDDWPEHSKT